MSQTRGRASARRYLIVNADDFGASRGINEGIAKAHVDGIVTSASLMVNMAATHQAVDMASSMPTLSVGLHVNFTNEGVPVMDLDDTMAASRELEHQYELFCAFVGIHPTHIDSHHDIHRLAHLEPIFVEFAARQALPMREHSQAVYVSQFYGQWDGETHTEQISPEMLIDLIRENVLDGVTEIGCHPGYFDEDFTSVYHEEREVELASLCDPNVRRVIEEDCVRLVGFADLGDLTLQRGKG